MNYYEDEIKKINPCLELEHAYTGHSVSVCRVRRNSQQFILKYAHSSQYWDTGHLQKEIQVLQKAGGVRGITQLLEVYEPACHYLAILKEFFPGFTLKELGRKPRLPNLRESLEAALCELHSRGIANLDIDIELGRNNVVYSPELRQAKIIDAVSRNGEMIYLDQSSQAYYLARNKDLSNLKMLFA